eukprot:jgi/Pico_ML_1/51195/g2272.t1
MNGKLILEQADLLDSNEEDEEDVLKKQLEDIRYIRRVLQDESTLFSKMVYVHGNILDTMLMEAVQQARSTAKATRARKARVVGTITASF